MRKGNQPAFEPRILFEFIPKLVKVQNLERTTVRAELFDTVTCQNQSQFEGG
jgi:hypothetical protein